MLRNPPLPSGILLLCSARVCMLSRVHSLHLPLCVCVVAKTPTHPPVFPSRVHVSVTCQSNWAQTQTQPRQAQSRLGQESLPGFTSWIRWQARLVLVVSPYGLKITVHDFQAATVPSLPHPLFDRFMLTYFRFLPFFWLCELFAISLC